MGKAILLLILLCCIQGLAESSPRYKLEKLSSWDDPALTPVHERKYNDLYGYADAEGREYAFLGSLDGIYFLNITDPHNPELIYKAKGRYDSAINRDFHTYQHYLYAVADQGPSSLKIFDLQYLPDSVALKYDSDSLVKRTHNTFIDNQRLYLAAHTAPDGTFYPMSVLSLENPEAPELLGHLDPPRFDGEKLFNHVHDVHVRNDTAYCSAGSEGLHIYDYSNPTRPMLLSSLVDYPDKGYNHSGWLNAEGNRFVFADETHGTRLKYYDVSDIRAPVLLSTFGLYAELGSIAHNPYIRDSLIIVAYNHNGIVVFDKSDPQDIRMIARYDTHPDNTDDEGRLTFDAFRGAWGAYTQLPSGNIIASDRLNGLFVLSLKEDSRRRSTRKPVFYPNPFNRYFYITNPSENPRLISFNQVESLRITDMSGRSFENTWHIMSDDQIRVVVDPALQTGMYLVEIKYDDRWWREKMRLR